MSVDVIVDEVRRVRDELVKRYGGLDGWIEHLQAMDRERARKAKRRTVKKPIPKLRSRKAAATCTQTSNVIRSEH
jgi:hypothetical protein